MKKLSSSEENSSNSDSYEDEEEDEEEGSSSSASKSISKKSRSKTYSSSGSDSSTSSSATSESNSTKPGLKGQGDEGKGLEGKKKPSYIIVSPNKKKYKARKLAEDQSKKSKQKKRLKKRKLTVCLSKCRYDVVKRMTRLFDLKEVGEEEPWNIFWTDFSVSLERAMDMRRYQVINHFPGMNEICRKDLLSRNLNRMKKLFNKDFEIFPRTWNLPSDMGDLQSYASGRRNRTFICKPEMGCQGRGIFLVRNVKELNPFGKFICQLYVGKPFLIDDYKFDMRVFILITSCDPLRIYIHKEGFARFATTKYKQPTNTNCENSYMHLTNYAVNKYSRDYVVDDESGSKRKLAAVYKWMEENDHDSRAARDGIDDVIIKTIISAHPVLKHNYRTCFPNHDLSSACFEILGFDVLLDYKLKPYVLEVNHSPSFHTDSNLDVEIKEAVIKDAFGILNLKQLDRRKIEREDKKRIQERLLNKPVSRKEVLEDGRSAEEVQFQYEMEHRGGYRLIYPQENIEKYRKYFDQNNISLFSETKSSQARASVTQTQIEELNKKMEDEKRKRCQLGDGKNREKSDRERVRPESPIKQEKEKPKAVFKINRKALNGGPPMLNSFVPGQIVQEEELERIKGLNHRAMLIRSLGVEYQAFNLLSNIGTIVPEEEKIFRRLYKSQAGKRESNYSLSRTVTTEQT